MSRRKIEDRDGLVELHVRLHAEGKMSLRQIADLTGVSYETVRRDLARWHQNLIDSLSQSLSHNAPECDASAVECDNAKESR